MRGFLWFVAFGVLFAACTKDKAAVQTNTGTFLSVVKAKQGGGETVLNTITYNTDGFVSTRTGYKDYNTGLIGSKTVYVYRDGRLEHIDEQTAYGSSSVLSAAPLMYSRSAFVYNAGGKVIQKNYFLKKDEQYELQSFTTFTWNDQGLPSMETRYAADGALTGYSIYAYDDKGNVRSAAVYAINAASPEPALASKTDYTYDNGLNPYRNIYAAVENIPFSVNRNNMVSSSFTDYSAQAANPQPAVIRVEYTYNKDELPSTMNENGNLFSLEYQ